MPVSASKRDCICLKKKSKISCYFLYNGFQNYALAHFIYNIGYVHNSAGWRYSWLIVRFLTHLNRLKIAKDGLRLKVLDKVLNIFSQPARIPKGRSCCGLLCKQCSRCLHICRKMLRRCGGGLESFPEQGSLRDWSN